MKLSFYKRQHMLMLSVASPNFYTDTMVIWSERTRRKRSSCLERTKLSVGDDPTTNHHHPWRITTNITPPKIQDIDMYVRLTSQNLSMPSQQPIHSHFIFNFIQMTHLIPQSESLKCTKERSSVYWDETIAPALQQGKTLLIVGHENNLRSLIMRLEDIPEEDIINLCLPRAVPLAYRLDENLKPLDRPDGRLDEATGFLRGEWLGGDDAVAEILERDRKQVYDTTVEQNLEMDESRKKWSNWMNLIVGEASPEAKAKAEREEEKMAA